VTRSEPHGEPVGAEPPAAGEPGEQAVVLRPGEPQDLDRLAALCTRVRVDAVPFMPPSVHTAAEDRAWIADQLAGEREVWLAESSAGVLGYMILEPGWLHSLYVGREHWGRGVGSALLDLAKSLRPAGLELWVFVSNRPARAFYERRGFVEVARTDGAGNEERQPDIRMRWPGPGGTVGVR
jgi:GNAT superfamily N-acetyltransferase